MKYFCDEAGVHPVYFDEKLYYDEASSRSSSSNDDDEDYLTYHQLRVLHAKRRRRESQCRKLFAAIVIGIIVLLCLGSQYRVNDAPEPEPQSRRAVILASYRDQDVSWLSGLSSDWEIYRYIMDDPQARFYVPRNQGREAMAYTTFIIDHYDDLPDHMVFIHGHDQAWHSVEPMAWKLEALNRTALDLDHYISLRCSLEPSANPARPVNLTKPNDLLGPIERLLPWFWGVTDLTPEVPEALNFPCCAQFAASKAATLARTRSWWNNFRKPLLRDFSDFNVASDDDVDTYGWGLLYEKIWHVAFGMPPLFSPDEGHCFREQWSDAVRCNRYLTAPFFTHPLDEMEDVECYWHDPKDIEDNEPFEYRIWSACNYTNYSPHWDTPIWYSSDPGHTGRPRSHPCPGWYDDEGW